MRRAINVNRNDQVTTMQIVIKNRDLVTSEVDYMSEKNKVKGNIYVVIKVVDHVCSYRICRHMNDGDVEWITSYRDVSL